MKTEHKDFDCVELMHEGAKKICEDTKGMTHQQELEYWNKKMEQMAWPINQHGDDQTANNKQQTTPATFL